MQQKSWRGLPGNLAQLAVTAAVPLHSFWLALVGLIAGVLAKPLTVLPFRERVLMKPRKEEYLQQQKQATSSYASGTSLLKTLCELEMWDEAGRELHHLHRSGEITETEECAFRARIALGRERYDEVIDLAEASAEQPEDLKLLLALAYATQGRREEALRTLNAAGRPKGHDAKRPRGDVYAALGDYETAMSYYEQNFAFYRNYHTLSAMGTVLMALGEYKEARSLFRNAVLNTPYRRAKDLRMLAQCCRAFGDERCAQEAEQLIEECP